MKKTIIIIAAFMFLIINQSLSYGFDINTLLIIIDESENGRYNEELKPVSDGIFEVLWEKEMIVFDYQLSQPIQLNGNNLSINSYLSIAAESGADAVLLIKLNYSTEVEQNGLKIVLTNCYYNLYSVNNRRSYKSGVIPLNINNRIEIASKIIFLNDIGKQIINNICE